jgi:CubicO group peptidase (beta-lactamase class C family)
MTQVIRLEKIADLDSAIKGISSTATSNPKVSSTAKSISTQASTHTAVLPKESFSKDESPQSLNISGKNFKSAKVLFEEGVIQQVYPGAVLQVGSSTQEHMTSCVGVRGLSSFFDPASATEEEDSEVLRAQSASSEYSQKLHSSPTTVYDVGSLTQVISTATIAMQLIAQKTINLDDKVARYLQGFGVNQKSDITLEQILAHTSGLPVMPHYFEELAKLSAGQRLGILTSNAAKEYVYSAINKLAAKNKPGKIFLRTEAGIVLLGHIMESLTGLNLNKLSAKSIFGPLRMNSSSFIDLGLLRRRTLVPDKDIIAPTEDCIWRQRLLWGEVFDDNAWAMGGVSAHSGLFSSLNDISIFAKELLKAYRGQSALISQEMLRHFWLGIDFQKKERLPFIWEHAKRDNFMHESGLSHLAVGINSPTGCSLWFEPEKDLYIILLSNSVHPQRGSKKLQTLRPLLFQEILKNI